MKRTDPGSQQEKNMIRNVAVVSLSRGIIGEPDVQFEVEIGLRRLKEYGLHVKVHAACTERIGIFKNFSI